jgi:hypothetical protein
MRALLMRFTLLTTLLLVATACNKTLATRPPLPGRLYYPTGIAFVPPTTDGGVGRIYAASSNFDRRFENGWVTSIDLSAVRSQDGRSLPPPGVSVAPPPDGGSDQGRPVQFTDLATDGGSIVLTDSFAGIATVDPIHNRLFVPTRSAGELDELAVMEVTPDGGPALSCYFSGGTDCTLDAIQVALEQTPGARGYPAAPQPYSVTVAPPPRDEIYMTSLRPASSPAQSTQNLQNYLVTLHQGDLDAARAAYPSRGQYIPPNSAFSPIGRGSSNSVIVDDTFLFISGRVKFNTGDPDVLLRIVERDSKLVAFPQLQLVWASLEARALQLRPPSGSRPPRLYLAVQFPSALMVIDIGQPPASDLPPAVTLVRAVPLPEGPNDVQLIARPGGQSPLVAITCYIDGSVVFYDDDLGQIAALIPGVGALPFAMSVDSRGPDWARIYVSNFGDGRIAVIDVPLSPIIAGEKFSPRLIGHVGSKQYCLINTDQPNCVDTFP